MRGAAGVRGDSRRRSPIIPPLPRIGARLRPHLIALVIYFVAAILLTWPMVTNFTTAIASAKPIPGYLYASVEDGIQNVWNVWWALRALTAGQNPFWTDLLFYPDGVQLYVQTLGLINILPILPVAALFGPVAGFNAGILLAMAASGYAAFLLARFFTPRLSIALLCGLLLTASPLHMLKLQIHQVNLISVEWLALYLLALLHLERAPSWRTVAATVGAALLVLLGDWYWLLIALICSVPWALAALARSTQRARLLWAFFAVGVGVFLAALPMLAGMLLARNWLPKATPHDSIWLYYIKGFSSDALTMFAPNMLHPLWGEMLWRLIRPAQTNFATDGWYVAAGWVLLACAAIGLPRLWRQQRPLALMAAGAWIFSLGPELQVAGYQTGIPMPYALLQNVPLLQIARRPSLFTMVVVLVAVVAAAMGLQQLAERLAAPRRNLLLGGVAMLAVIELAPPGPAQRQQIPLAPPALMSQIAARPGPVADLPFTGMEDGRSLLNQIGHGQPIIGGYVARWPSYLSQKQVPLLAAIRRMRLGPEIVPLDIVPLDADALLAMQCAYPLRHVLLYQPELSLSQQAGVADIAATLAGAPVTPTQAGDYLWYELPLVSPPCAPFVSLGLGWGDLESGELGHWRWMGDAALINLVNPQPAPQTVQLGMSLIAFAEPRRVEIFSGETLDAAWTVGSDQVLHYVTQVVLQPGVNELRLRAPATPDPAAPRLLSLRADSIQVRPMAAPIK